MYCMCVCTREREGEREGERDVVSMKVCDMILKFDE
jgi:hypothetical protein